MWISSQFENTRLSFSPPGRCLLKFSFSKWNWTNLVKNGRGPPPSWKNEEGEGGAKAVGCGSAVSRERLPRKHWSLTAPRLALRGMRGAHQEKQEGGEEMKTLCSTQTWAEGHVGKAGIAWIRSRVPEHPENICDVRVGANTAVRCPQNRLQYICQWSK